MKDDVKYTMMHKITRPLLNLTMLNTDNFAGQLLMTDFLQPSMGSSVGPSMGDGNVSRTYEMFLNEMILSEKWL